MLGITATVVVSCVVGVCQGQTFEQPKVLWTGKYDVVPSRIIEKPVADYCSGGLSVEQQLNGRWESVGTMTQIGERVIVKALKELAAK
jgi:hypothetical protein